MTSSLRPPARLPANSNARVTPLLTSSPCRLATLERSSNNPILTGTSSPQAMKGLLPASRPYAVAPPMPLRNERRLMRFVCNIGDFLALRCSAKVLRSGSRITAWAGEAAPAQLIK